jgi:hypothetical protein
MKVKPLFLILPLIFLLFSISCNKSNPPESGAVKATLYDYTGLDGCSWVIKVDNNEVLELDNPEQLDFKLKDGKKVWLKYHLSESQTSICMVGPKINVDAIWDR